MDTKALIRQARQAVAASSCNSKKLTAIHAGVAAAAGLIVALLSYLLDSGMGGTGGLSGIGTRALLETVQSVLSLAVNILNPFWGLGFVAVTLAFALPKASSASRRVTSSRRTQPVRMRFFSDVSLFFFSICNLPSPLPLKRPKIAHKCATFSKISQKYMSEGQFFFPSTFFDAPTLYSAAPFVLECEQFFFQGVFYGQPSKS